MTHQQPGLDGRHRDVSGQIHKKRGDTLLRTVRETYPGFAPHAPGDMRLDTWLSLTGIKSLAEGVRISRLITHRSSWPSFT
ncbi:hypothetical protein AZA_84997 [Nitrospirillum viridazoti Y2]|nr:hypothetical protein AZA_84997 [Nitrospirillum amazonense Y2]